MTLLDIVRYDFTKTIQRKCRRFNQFRTIELWLKSIFY